MLITTRLPIGDIAEHERASALRRDLEQLSSDAGANLLQSLGVKGDETELRSTSDEFNGCSLADYLRKRIDNNYGRGEKVSGRRVKEIRSL